MGGFGLPPFAPLFGLKLSKVASGSLALGPAKHAQSASELNTAQERERTTGPRHGDVWIEADDTHEAAHGGRGVHRAEGGGHGARVEGRLRIDRRHPCSCASISTTTYAVEEIALLPTHPAFWIVVLVLVHDLHLVKRRIIIAMLGGGLEDEEVARLVLDCCAWRC